MADGGTTDDSSASQPQEPVKFGAPQRSSSVRRFFSTKRPNRSSTSLNKINSDDNGAENEALPYRPVKPKFVQLRITSHDLHLKRKAPVDNFRRPSTAEPPASISAKGKERTGSTSASSGSGSVPRSIAAAYKFDTTPTLTRTPWERERGRPGSKWTREPAAAAAAAAAVPAKVLPRRFFAQLLPREIYQCILGHVEDMHTSGTIVDVAALQADLRALCLVSKTWLMSAREHLYCDLWLPSNMAFTKRKWSRQPGRSPLWRLLVTLRDSPGLAFIVHRVHVTAALAEQLQEESLVPFRRGSTLDALRELILNCYNIEEISGYVPSATASALPLFNALASRTRLKSHAWHLDSEQDLPSLGDFVFCHDDWLYLETLVISADLGVDLGGVAITAILPKLPVLKHLMLSGLHRSDYSNGALLKLPPLKSLRLQRLGGISDQGVEQLAYSLLATSLESLSFVDLELVSLQTIKILLSHLTALRRFTLVQKTSPEPQLSIRPASRTQLLSSLSLTYLHWDCLMPGAALSNLASAISLHCFPALSTIKVPCDSKGDLQALCRPIASQKLSPEDFEYLALHTPAQEPEHDLRLSRISAQLRVLESRQTPSFNFVVQDEDLAVRHTGVIGSFLGKMESRVEYCLEPDVEGGSTALAGFEDVAGPPASRVREKERRLDLGILF